MSVCPGVAHRLLAADEYVQGTHLTDLGTNNLVPLWQDAMLDVASLYVRACVGACGRVRFFCCAPLNPP
jgi:hypothetical protein